MGAATETTMYTAMQRQIKSNPNPGYHAIMLYTLQCIAVLPTRATIMLYYASASMPAHATDLRTVGRRRDLSFLLRPIYPPQSMFCTTTSRLSYQLFIFIFYSNQLQNYVRSDRNSVVKRIELLVGHLFLFCHI